MSTASENEKKRQGKSAAAIAAFDAAEQGGAKKVKPKPKAKPKEKRGTGKDTAAAGKSRLLIEIDTRVALMRKNLAAAKKTGNNALANRLAAAIAKNEANRKTLSGS